MDRLMEVLADAGRVLAWRLMLAGLLILLWVNAPWWVPLLMPFFQLRLPAS